MFSLQFVCVLLTKTNTESFYLCIMFLFFVFYYSFGEINSDHF